MSSDNGNMGHAFGPCVESNGCANICAVLSAAIIRIRYWTRSMPSSALADACHEVQLARFSYSGHVALTQITGVLRVHFTVVRPALKCRHSRIGGVLQDHNYEPQRLGLPGLE